MSITSIFSGELFCSPLFFINQTLMKRFFIFFLIILCHLHCHAQEDMAAFRTWAPTPPMGWNSWDCYFSSVTEKEVMFAGWRLVQPERHSGLCAGRIRPLSPLPFPFPIRDARRQEHGFQGTGRTAARHGLEIRHPHHERCP